MDEVVKAACDDITSEDNFYNNKREGRGRLLIMSGLPMSGKSYLSNMILEKRGGKICLVRSDEIRPIVVKHMGYNEPRYTKDEHARVFDLGHYLVKRAINNGWPVIADATNLTDQYRQWAVKGAEENGGQTLVAFLDISHETAMERNKDRDRSGSTATPSVYALLNFEKEPLERCTSPYVIINSEVDIAPWAEKLAKWLTHEIEDMPGVTIPKTYVHPRHKGKKRIRSVPRSGLR